jgi:tetratricopeptide (TPR) repeat protein
MAPRGRSIAFAAILARCLCALSAQGLPPDPACRRAVELHQSGKIEQSIPDYETCLEAHPTNVEARSNLGAALARLGRYDEAIDQYRRALEGAPDHLGLRLNLALSYYKSARFPEAIRELTQVHAARPEDENATLLLADCYLRQGRYAQVIELLAPLERAQPDNEAIAYLLGTALIRNGQVEEGQKLVNRILRNGDSAEARFLLATGIFMARDYPRAVKEFARVIELKPDLPGLQSYYGQALLYTGDPDGAADAFRKELAANPNDFDANELLGEILAARKQSDAAETFLRRALELRPDSVQAKNALTRLKSPALTDKESDTGLLAVGSTAPGFSLRNREATGNVTLESLRAAMPVVAVFGSYTCPKFRFDAKSLNGLAEKYSANVAFLLVYVHEAHASGDWQSTINDRENVTLAPAATFDQKVEHANTCARKLGIRFPIAVDDLDRKVESAYAAWPSAIYLVGRDGRVLWRSRLGEQDFRADEMQSAIDTALGSSPHRP